MQKISIEELKIICKTLKKKIPNKHPDFYKMGLSTELLRLMIDNEWVNQSIFKMHKNKPSRTNEARNFLKTKDMGFQWQERVRRLAERIFNLQNIKNIEDIINKIKEGNLTSRFAELEAGTLFYRREIPFQFVEPVGKKRFDFDIKIMTNPQINCEVKHKIESTSLSKTTIIRSLKKARSQVPNNEPGLIVLKIPEEWTKDVELKKISSNALDTFYNQNESKNIIGILFRWESRHSEHKGGFLWNYKLEKNIQSNLINSEIEKIFQKIESKYTKWVDFEMIIKECL